MNLLRELYEMNDFFDQLDEGINDKGIFKCLMLSGAPATGKSTLIKQILSATGNLPRVVDFDHIYEYLGSKRNIDLSVSNSSSDQARDLRKTAREKTRTQVSNYMKGMLPLIIDNTALEPKTAVARVKLLENYGYDVLVIFCKADLDTRLVRAAGRARGVSPEVIKNTQQQSDVVVDKLYNTFHENDIPMYMYDSTDPNAEEPIVRACTKFFNEPVQNPLGKFLRWDYFKRNQKERNVDPSKDISVWNN